MLSPATALTPSLPPAPPGPAGKVAGDGNITSLRDPWFQLVNSAMDASLASGGPLRGALFWQVCACGRGSVQDKTHKGSLLMVVLKVAAVLFPLGSTAPSSCGLLTHMSPCSSPQWDGESGPRGDSAVRSGDTTFGIIQQFSHKMAASGPMPVPGCTPRGNATGDAAPATAPNAVPNGTTPGVVSLLPTDATSQPAGRKLLRG